MATISIKDMMYKGILESPSFTGIPTIANNPIVSTNSLGEPLINGQPAEIKTKEYKLPTSGNEVANIVRPMFELERTAYGFGSDIFPQLETIVVYVDPSTTTNGVGTLASPYKTWPTSISNDSLILIKEYTTLVVTTSITISATNVIIGTYDSSTGDRVIDQDRLATIQYSSMAKLFSHSAANSSITFSGLKFYYAGTAEAANSIYSNIISTIKCQIEYCVFVNIKSVVSGVVTSALIDTAGSLIFRFNYVVKCEANSINCYGSSIKIYGNEFRYNTMTLPIIIIKTTGSGYHDIHRNFLVNPSNHGSIINVSNTSETYIKKNYILGGLSDNTGTGSTNIKTSGAANTFIHDNYSINGLVGITTSSTNCKIYKNIIASEYNNFTGVIGTIIVNNTIIRMAGSTGVAIVGSTTISNNIIDGNGDCSFTIGVKINGATTVISNLVDNCDKPFVNTSEVEIQPPTSNILSSSNLDYYFSPYQNSLASDTGTINAQYGVYNNKGAIQQVSRQ